MFKKSLMLLSLLFIIFTLSSCTKKEELYVINLGDYINEELLYAFEEKYNCSVIYEERSTNEELYQRITHESYDVAIVEEYLIDKLRQDDLILKIDYSKLESYSEESYFSDALTLMNTELSNIKDYYIPYFWGTFGIMYRTDKEGLKEYIEENSLESVFINNQYKVGMYNSARFSISMALLSLGYDVNSFNMNELKEAEDLLTNAHFEAWGDDNLKQLIANGSLDYALVYSGDYIDQYYKSSVDNQEIKYSYYKPNKTIVWVDGYVIPKNNRNESLAYKFITFMNEADNILSNGSYVGYAPLNETIFDRLFSECDYSSLIDRNDFYPYTNESRVLKYVSDEHYNYLNDLLDEIKNKSRK